MSAVFWDRKGLAKSILDGLLTGLGLLVYRAGMARPIIHLHRHSPKVLMYHACEDAESDFTRGLSINTTPSQFASHLDFLMRYYRIVPLDDLLRGSPPEPTVVITFDDGFRSVYEHAWPRLRERDLTATCYLVTDVVENNALIWLNELNWLLHRHGSVARPIVSEALGPGRACPIGVMIRALRERYEPAKMAGLLSRLRAAVGVDPGTLARTHRLHLRWDQIAEMASAGMTFGNHTGSHPPLANLPIVPCREEIRRAAAALAHLPGAGATLAYPFGSRNETTRQVALELGHRSLMEVEGVNSPLDPTRIARIKVGSFSPAVLFARMEIVEPVKARLKRWLRLAKPQGRSGGT